MLRIASFEWKSRWLSRGVSPHSYGSNKRQRASKPPSYSAKRNFFLNNVTEAASTCTTFPIIGRIRCRVTQTLARSFSTEGDSEIETRRAKRENDRPLLEEGLSAEQRTVLGLVVEEGKNVFFTGPAGTGKPFLLKRIIKALTEKYDVRSEERVGITASTGLASFSINGQTLHSWASIKTGEGPVWRMIVDIRKSKTMLDRWKSARVLVVDEISMVSADLFNKLDNIGRRIRGNDQPFGGIQIVVTGDFHQLPPVINEPVHTDQRFCFEAQSWKAAIEHTIGLTHVYRQEDPEFAKMLTEMRGGSISPSTVEVFRALSRPLPSSRKQQPQAAELYPLRREAGAANAKHMRKLESGVYTYFSDDTGGIGDAKLRKKLLDNCMAPKVLHLKKGAQVMLIRNLREGLVNGSLGRVLGFASPGTFDAKAWEESADKDECWDSGNVTPWASTDKKAELVYPVVRFDLGGNPKNGGNGQGGSKTILCGQEKWSIDRWFRDKTSADGWSVVNLATRRQVPLILAWALSIHKAQGQTLDRVKVDVGKVFEPGQAYVAFSRARSMEGLQVVNFDPAKVKADPKVKAFYANLANTTDIQKE